MPADHRSAPPADWYVDLDDPSRGRYWDGTAWTDDRVDIPDGLALALFPRRSTHRQRQSRSRAVLVAAAVVGVVGCAGAGAGVGWWVAGGDERQAPAAQVAGTAMVRLRGSIDLEDPTYIGRESGAPCDGAGALAGVDAGLAVTVRAGGATVGVARLRPGHLVAAASDLPDSDLPVELGELIPVCRFDFGSEVPALATYDIEVEGHGSQTWTREELEASDWTARMDLTP